MRMQAKLLLSQESFSLEKKPTTWGFEFLIRGSR